ncbi:MAG: hypothetical protein IPQ01_18830 [Zoogloea sp.]|nr:hypothetical protein [Zoogloea sp.]
MPTPACSPTTNLTRLMLDSYLGKNISEICPHGFDDAELNHCAHLCPRRKRDMQQNVVGAGRWPDWCVYPGA